MKIKHLLFVIISSLSFTLTAQCNLTINHIGEENQQLFVATFIDSLNQPVGNFVWNFGDGKLKIGNYLGHQFTKNGSHKVTVSFMSEDSTCKSTASIVINQKRERPIVKQFITQLFRRKNRNLAGEERKNKHKH